MYCNELVGYESEVERRKGGRDQKDNVAVRLRLVNALEYWSDCVSVVTDYLTSSVPSSIGFISCLTPNIGIVPGARSRAPIL